MCIHLTTNYSCQHYIVTELPCRAIRGLGLTVMHCPYINAESPQKDYLCKQCESVRQVQKTAKTVKRMRRKEKKCVVM